MASPQNSDNVTPATPEVLGDANSTWVVELLVSGGFAGVRRNIKISSSGDAIIVDEKKTKQIHLDLPESDLEKLSKLVADIEQLPNVSAPSPCVDCFQYEVDVFVQNSQFHALYNDENLSQSGIKPLVFELVRLMNDALEK